MIDTTEMEIFLCADRFTKAVHTLATHRGSLKRRIALAYQNIQVFQESELPESVREDFRWVVNSLTSHEPINPDGTVFATLHFMKFDKAEKIAQRICGISAKLNAMLMRHQ